MGIIDSYDPALYCAKVLLQPENVLTGFLPVGTEFVGDGWGLVIGPTPGDVVEVQYQEGSKNAGYIGKRYFSASTVPPGPVPSGEFWLVHASGSLLKFHNDGSVELSANANLTLGAPNGIFRVAAEQIQLHATQIFRFDANGHGQSWNGTSIDTYQIGEVAGTTNAISPPEIGN